MADRLSPFKHLAGGVQVVFLHALASLEFLMSLGFFRTGNSSNTGNPRNGRKASNVKRVYKFPVKDTLQTLSPGFSLMTVKYFS